MSTSVETLEYFGSLTNGIRYYGTVQAVNGVGLRISVTTDGIIVDTEEPFAGAVMDGDQLTDRQYQSNTTSLSASWHGFFDRHSFIDHYDFGIGSFPGKDSIASFHNVGLHLYGMVGNLNLASGQTYFAVVVAWDSAGIKSRAVSSDGVTIDITPPKIVSCADFGQNVLTNFSSSEKKNDSILRSGEMTGEWNVTDGIVELITTDVRTEVFLSGTISHSYDFTANLTYQLEIFGQSLGTKRSQQVHVTAPGLNRQMVFDSERSKGNRYYCQIKVVLLLSHFYCLGT